MTRALLILQVLTLGAVGWLVLDRMQPPPPAAGPAPALVERATALEEEGRFGAAGRAWRRAGDEDRADRARALGIASSPELPDALSLQSLDDLRQELEAAGHRAAAAALEVTLLRRRGDLSAAAAAGAAALERGDESPWLRWQLGAIRLQQGRVSEAIGELETVARDRPTFAPNLHRLGLAYLADKRRDASIESLQRAIERGAGRAAQLDLAGVFLQGEMWAEAVPFLESALRARGDDAETLRLLAAAHFRLKRFDLAARTYRQAYAIEPEPRTLLSAAIALHGGGALAESLSLLDAILPRDEALPEIRFERALLLEEMKRPDAAKADLRRYLKVAAGRPEEAKRVAVAEEKLK